MPFYSNPIASFGEGQPQELSDVEWNRGVLTMPFAHTPFAHADPLPEFMLQNKATDTPAASSAKICADPASQISYGPALENR